MVFFSCDGCAEVLKKSQVDGHASRCRKCSSVSCVDCLVSFYGDDYRSHTSCLTEVERYEKRDPAKRKAAKQTPQEAWMSLLADSVKEAPTYLRQHITDISRRDNVPRKEKQFRNFVANSMKISNSVVEQIWNFLKELKDKQQAAKDEQKKIEASQVKDEAIEDAKIGNKEESKSTWAVDVDDSDKKSSEPLLSSDEVKKAMKKILKKEKDNTMPIKTLRKAVCAKYGLEKKGKKLMKKLLKQHLSGKKFVINGKVVRLKVD